MKQYLDLLQDIVDNGVQHEDRTGHGRISVFGRQQRYDLREGFPLITTKKVFLRGIIEELLWIIRGSTNAQELVDRNVHIWDDWMVKEEHIDQFIQHIPVEFRGHLRLSLANERGVEPNEVSEEEVFAFLRGQYKDSIGSIGNLYGKAWRNAPIDPDATDAVLTNGKKAYSKLLSDKRKIVDDALAEIGKTADDLEDNILHAVILQRVGGSVDQLGEVLYGLKTKPFSSRHVVSAWIPAWVPDESVSPELNVLAGMGALAACHCMFQFFVTPGKEGEKNKLSCMLTQRSHDVFLGGCFNIASYAIFTMMMAQVLDMEAFEFIHSSGDTHIYPYQMEAVKEQLSREPRQLPTLTLNPDVKDILAFKVEDFTIAGYDPHPAIKVAVAK